MSASHQPYRVLIADDHTIVREGLRALLDGVDELSVVGEADTGLAAVREAKRLAPDVVLMDLSLPELNGVDATREILASLPNTRVLVLSMHDGEEYVRPAVRAGAVGYLVKGSGLADLVAAIEAVCRGDAFFSPTAARALLQDRGGAPSPSAAVGGANKAAQIEELTPREREVLQLVGEGKSSAEIARLLTLSVKTVEGHRSRLMQKLAVPNVAGLVRHAVRLGLVDVRD